MTAIWSTCTHTKMAGWMDGHQTSFQELINPRPRPVDNSGCVGVTNAAHKFAHYLLRLNDRISERSEKRLVSIEPTLPPKVPMQGNLCLATILSWSLIIGLVCREHCGTRPRDYTDPSSHSLTRRPRTTTPTESDDSDDHDDAPGGVASVNTSAMAAKHRLLVYVKLFTRRLCTETDIQISLRWSS